MPLFELPKKGSVNVADLKSRVSNTTAPAIVTGASGKSSGGQNIIERINSISLTVNKFLGKYADDYVCIRDEETLKNYFDACIANGEVAVDTETSGGSNLSCVIAGFSLYTPGQKAAYVPINHLSYITMERLENQIEGTFASAQFERLNESGTKIIMHTARYDVGVLINNLKVKVTCYWDCYIAARLLNENEPENGLKQLHRKYCTNGEDDALSFSDLFEDFNFQFIPLKVGFIYAAHDAKITYELYKFQLPYLTKGTPECEESNLTRVCDVFRDIEMRVLPAFIEIEQTGVCFDYEVQKRLSEKYHKRLEEREKKFWDVCNEYRVAIDSYKRVTGISCKLEDPINIGSPTQIAILLYDVLKLKNLDKRNPRGTGEEIISKIDHPVCKAILDYREVAKILSTYVDKMPEIVMPHTGRVHATFNQVGADTGRVSSKDPNMQNIPSRGEGKEIRNIFCATPGYCLISSDYSAQEPRLTAHLSNDERMIKAYKEGKDLYCEIASIAFNVPYEECMEHRPDGSTNPEGKKRRATAKIIVLGVIYSKTVKSIAEDLNVSKKKAQEIYDKIMEEFPGLKTFMVESEKFAVENGYVETVWGRKRRLPDLSLPPFEFKRVKQDKNSFDPLAEDDADEFDAEYIDPSIIDYYWGKMEHTYNFEQKAMIRDEALKEGIQITDNVKKIAEARRQVVNSRVQGSAADQTKKAMILIHESQRMHEIGFRMLIPVHDEIMGEAPLHNAVEAGNLLSQLMVEAAKDLIVPSKCDVEYSLRWADKEINPEEYVEKNGL